MPMIQTDSQHYTDIADAIRDMSGSSEVFYPADMAGGVRSIPQTIAIAPIIYSLEEREVGVWTDGKPLYEKTLTVASNASINNNQWTAISWNNTPTNIEKLLGCEIHLYGTEYVVPNPYVNLRFRYINDAICCASGISATLYAGSIITFKYTKTTDTPGSGTWTPSGVPAHHYSTNEQVIGTWIDGKPLYEKTIVDNMTHSGGSINISHNISNIDEVTNISGVYSFGANNTWYYPISFADDPSTGNTNSVFKFCGINRSTNTILMYAGSNYGGTVSITKIRITLQYTKTTD